MTDKPKPGVEELAFVSSLFTAGDPIDVQLQAADVERLERAAEALKLKVAGYEGVADVSDTFRGGKREIALTILPEAEALGLTLEDLAGSAEVIVFSDPFAEAGPILGSEGPFIVQGTVDANGDKPKIKAVKVELLEDYRQRVTSMIQINLTSIGLTAEDLGKLKNVLGRHHGECRVRLRLTIPTKAEAVIDFSDQFKVNSSEEMLNEVERIFGHGSVTFV